MYFRDIFEVKITCLSNMDAAILKLRAVRKGPETNLIGKDRVQIYL